MTTVAFNGKGGARTDEQEFDLRQIIQFNANNPSPVDGYNVNKGRVLSNPSELAGSRREIEALLAHPMRKRRHASPDKDSIGIHNYTAHASTPETGILTPTSTTSETARVTRYGRSQIRSTSEASRSRVSKSRPSRSKAMAGKAPRLDKPLSELTKGMTVPVRNMEAHVNRPAEDRQREAEKRNGYITRPMNSFMLYRSAYADRTKQWCLQNNHQVVSAVSGESWPLEPDGVREYYSKLARVERDNHAFAFPTYKFSPNKGLSASKRRKANASHSSDEEDDLSVDLEDGESEYRPRSERRNTRVRRASQMEDVPQYNSFQSHFTPNDGYNMSSWSPNIGDQQMHMGFSEAPINYPYFNQQALWSPQNHPMHTPQLGDSFDFGVPSGMPGTTYNEVMPSQMPTHMSGQFGQQLDPALLDHDFNSVQYPQDDLISPFGTVYDTGTDTFIMNQEFESQFD